jgi:hypothetical protein
MEGRVAGLLSAQMGTEPPPPPAPVDAGASRASSTIVFVLALLFLADTFLAWQRLCVQLPRELGLNPLVCVHANAWHGTAAGLGWIAGIAAILLLLWEGARLAGAEIDLGMDHRSVTTVLTGAVLVGGVLKWILVLGNYPGPGAWIGLVLVVCLAGYVALRPRTS